MELKPHPKHNVLSQWYSNIIFLSKSPFGKMAFCLSLSLSLCHCLYLYQSLSVCLSIFISLCVFLSYLFLWISLRIPEQNKNLSVWLYWVFSRPLTRLSSWEPDPMLRPKRRLILQGHLFLGQLPPCARQNCVQKRKLWPFFFLFSSCWLIILLIIFSPSFAIPQSTMY